MTTKTIAVVTGGAGFIGSHMVDLLIKKDFKVIVLDNFAGGHKKNIKHHFQIMMVFGKKKERELIGSNLIQKLKM